MHLKWLISLRSFWLKKLLGAQGRAASVGFPFLSAMPASSSSTFQPAVECAHDVATRNAGLHALVPGTEGRKAQLRFDGHGSNLLFGSPSFFATPNFADTYSPLVKLLHDGPSQNSHLILSGACQPAGGLEAQAPHAYLASVEPKMPPLRQMHELVASDPRAQAKFFLLMSELHYRCLLGLERLHIGRTTLARPRRPVHDMVACTQIHQAIKKSAGATTTPHHHPSTWRPQGAPKQSHELRGKAPHFFVWFKVIRGRPPQDLHVEPAGLLSWRNFHMALVL